MRVSVLPKMHNTMTRPGLEPGPVDPESSALTSRAPRVPRICYLKYNYSSLVCLFLVYFSILENKLGVYILRRSQNAQSERVKNF